jgi:DnaK suppressor protein
LGGVRAAHDLRAALPVGANPRAPTDASARDAEASWSVADLMTHAPDTLGPDDTLQLAAERMADRRIGCLPIVDGAGRLMGILSETDVLRALATHLWTERLAEQRTPVAPEKSLLKELERERDAVAKDLAQLADRDRRRTEQRREPGDLADAAALRSDEQLAEALEGAKARRLAALEHALERAAQGRFGTCDRCGERIPVGRLRALPGSTTCIRCAQGEPVRP